MEHRTLGQTGIRVSRLAFGTLTFKIREIPVEQGADLLVSAAEMGITFFDLGEIYETYPHMRLALQQIDDRPVIAAKSMAKDAESMRMSVKRALDEIGVAYVDIFKLHNVDSIEDLMSRRSAWEALLEARADGLVRAIGVSTHSCEVLREIIGWHDVDVILTVYNQGRQGVLQGTMSDMLSCIKAAHRAGKGVYLMKALAGGLLYANPRQALEFAFSVEEADSVAVGMHTLQEVIYNIAVAVGEEVPASVERNLKETERRWHVRPFCKGCGSCITACRYGALTMRDNKPVVDPSKCILCGYCGFACPVMAIKIL